MLNVQIMIGLWGPWKASGPRTDPPRHNALCNLVSQYNRLMQPEITERAIYYTPEKRCAMGWRDAAVCGLSQFSVPFVPKSLKCFSQLHPACKKVFLVGLLKVPPHFSLGSHFHIQLLPVSFFGILKTDTCVKQALHLVMQSCAVTPAATAIRV